MPTSAPAGGLADPVVLIVIVTSAIAVVAIASSLLNRRRATTDSAKRAAWINQQRERTAAERADIERRAIRIIATSSTAAITGFQITRQIEAVFTEGHGSPADAVDALKAIAAEKGANAIINLSGQRQGTGKCAAHGDAVIVRPIEGGPRPDASATGGRQDGDEPH